MDELNESQNDDPELETSQNEFREAGSQENKIVDDILKTVDPQKKKKRKLTRLLINV